VSAQRKPDPEQELREFIGGFTHDPLGFVLAAFPWGEPGPLKDKSGPDEWQRQHLIEMGEHLRNKTHEPFLEAIASGHGIGKSADVAWIILWAMSTCEDMKGVVTANTENQLSTKTWAELAKWYRLLICKHWFTFAATSIRSADPAHERTWRVDMVPWSERNMEAFAGLHNEGKRVLVVYDEASAIPDLIWETTEGALTDANTEIIWSVRGNPTRNTGRFRECFGRLRHRWHHKQIDSRDVAITNKAQIQKWIDDYGEDSDFARVRVKGTFPRAGSMQFIASNIVEDAMKRPPDFHMGDAIVLGVDVARFGDDETVITTRRGLDAKTYAQIKMRGDPSQPGWLMQVAGKVQEHLYAVGADMCFVDAGGVGAGVVDRLVQLNVPCIGIEFGGAGGRILLPGGEIIKVANKRAEIWAKMRAWLQKGCIPDDPDLEQDLIGVQYGYDTNEAIQLERKKDMKKRGLASPDRGDSLALTFAFPVQKNQGREDYVRPKQKNKRTGY